MSGYPSRAESEHDLVENSHASTALSYALRPARSPRRRRATTTRTSSRSSATARSPAGSPTRRSTTSAHSGRRASSSSTTTAAATRPRCRASPSPDAPGRPRRHRRRSSPRSALDYVGPVDGHDIAALEPALRDAAECTGPSSCTCSRTRARATCRPRPTTRSACTTSARSTPRPACRSAANGVVVHRRVHRCARSRWPRRGPRSSPSPRACPAPPGCSRSPSASPTAASTSASPSSTRSPPPRAWPCAGLRPVVAIYSTFLSRAWDQIVYDVGLHGVPVVFCIDRAGITGDDGPSHHGLYDLALLTKVPGLTLFAPSSYEEMAVMLEEALRITSGPVALRWPKTAARHVMPDAGRHRPRTRASVRAGDDVCILALGKMVEAAEEAAELLDARDVERHGVGHPHRPAPTRRCSPTRAVTRSWSPRRTASPKAAWARCSRPRSARWTTGDPHRRPSRWARRRRTSRTASPPTLLANLGLDGPGIAATVAKLLEDRCDPPTKLRRLTAGQ